MALKIADISVCGLKMQREREREREKGRTANLRLFYFDDEDHTRKRRRTQNKPNFWSKTVNSAICWEDCHQKECHFPEYKTLKLHNFASTSFAKKITMSRRRCWSSSAYRCWLPECRVPSWRRRQRSRLSRCPGLSTATFGYQNPRTIFRFSSTPDVPSDDIREIGVRSSNRISIRPRSKF